MMNPISLISPGYYLERSSEFTITAYTSAREALEREDLSRFDAIISDYLMPGMDGIQFLKEVRSRSPDIPFIIVTGKGSEVVVIEAINNGADYYLQKDLDMNIQFIEVAHKVKNWDKGKGKSGD